MRKYQYQVYNKHLNLLITIPIESEEYALNFAKRTAMDFYDAKSEFLLELKVEFICSFRDESVINVSLLSE